MIAPTPIRELVVQTYPQAAHVVMLYAASNDARAWIEVEAGKFGALCSPLSPGCGYMLYLSPLYDCKAAIAYLADYGA